MSKVVAAFHGTGKSYAYTKLFSSSDSDSSKFSWISEGVRNPNFIEDYMHHLKHEVKENSFVFVSTHSDVLAALPKHIPLEHEIVLVYPGLELKGEYLQRYTDRNSPAPFIQLLEKNWASFIGDCKNLNDSRITHIELQENETIYGLIQEGRL